MNGDLRRFAFILRPNSVYGRSKAY